MNMFFDLFRQIYRTPMMLLKLIMANPLGIFVYGILSQWYAMVIIAVVVVTFWTFKGLEKSGILESAAKTVQSGLMSAEAIAQNCTPLIANLGAAWECVKNPPKYVESDDEKTLRSNVQSALQSITPSSSQNSSSSDSSGSHTDTYINPYDAAE